jgi:hypothetical protein
MGQQREWTILYRALVGAHLELARVRPHEAASAHRRAMEIAEAGKSRLLTELLGRANLPAPPDIPPELVEREQKLMEDLTNLDAVELAAYGPSIDSHEEISHSVQLQQREDKLHELNDLWTQMVRYGKEAVDYVALRRGLPLAWEDIARLATDLGAETALVSFFTIEDRTLLLIVRAGWVKPELVEETGFGDLAWIKIMRRLFREFHTSEGSLRRGETWDRELRRLLKNARPHLEGVTRIVLTPYSNGHLIPWSVVAERAGWRDPAQQILPLVTLPALGLLSRLRVRPSPRGNAALVAGNPLGDLKYSEEEAREVAAILETKALLGSNATKAKVKASLSEATVIHLATHAYFSPDSPLDSGVVLANGDVLTAREVMGERMSADLLILSACETGMAQSLGGDELAGLAQAFLQAGVQSVIVSLWSVNDWSTAALMKSFYQGRRAGADKAQALKQAMTEVQEQWRHPYHWGAFVLMGNW